MAEPRVYDGNDITEPEYVRDLEVSSDLDDVMEELGGVDIDTAIMSEKWTSERVPGWMGLMPAWPCRLLHVGTMTSVLRDDGNVYAGRVEPRYNILSYTWGRFTNPGGRSIDIKGTEWVIPAIHESHFTVENLEAVVREVGRHVEFIWVDIACIHQEDDKEKLEEVGKQAGIFKNAHKAFIWLNRHEHSVLTACVEEICYEGMLMVMRLGDNRQQTENPDTWTKLIRDGLKSVRTALEELFDDPWFTSLWTLQESVLRRDAFILSREGAYIFTSLSELPWQFKAVASACHEYYESLLPFSNIPTPSERNHITRFPRGQALQLLSDQTDIATSLCNLIHRRGLGFVWTSNPNIAYCVGQYRVTKDPLDQIFGIMQVYGINCGESRTSKDTLQLQDLEDEFGSELVIISPLLSQMFIHSEVFKPRRSWLITQKCSVPPALDIRGARFEGSKSNLCQMSVRYPGQINFRGKAWHFMDLLKSITLGDSMGTEDFRIAISRILQNHRLQPSNPISQEMTPLEPLTLEDATVFYSVRPPNFRQGSREIRLRPSSDAPEVSILLDRHHELRVGALDPKLDFIESGGRYRDEELNSLMIAIQVARTFGEANLRVLLLGQIPHVGLNVNVAVILRQVCEGYSASEIDLWDRIGLVVWHALPSQYDLMKGYPKPPLPMWHELEGRIQ